MLSARSFALLEGDGRGVSEERERFESLEFVKDLIMSREAGV